MDYIKGMDISTYKEIIECGAKYYDDGKPMELFDILKKYGVNSIRLRLWNDPYSEDKLPYGAGTNDIDTTIFIAKKVKDHGMGWLLDFHYSDFWTDPGKQYIPKQWQDFSVGELEDAVYFYTKETLCKLKEEKVMPDMVQIGNELTNGMLWPYGKLPNYDNLTRFINAGIRGVRAVDSTIPIMLHLDNGGNNAMYINWFDNYLKKGLDFQVIGLSYYPFWHGSFEDLRNNLNDLAIRYKKELIIAEVSMGYTMEDYSAYEGLDKANRKGMATKESLISKLDYPVTIEGQCDFMKELINIIKNVPNNLCKGYYYWEPAWIPVKGSGWATEASLKYINDAGPCGNEWANQALFDYKGNALPAIKLLF